MTRILVYEPAYQRVADRLAQIAPDAEVAVMQTDGVIRLNGETLTPDTAQPDIGWLSVDIFTGPQRDYWVTLLKSERLRWVQSVAAGFDGAGFGKLVEKGARLTLNTAQSISIAEYVLAGVLDHFQGGPRRRRTQAERRWAPRPFREIYGTEWLIVGFGGIGQAVAERARAFGARVVGVRRRAGENPLADRMVPLSELSQALPTADVVVVALPLTVDTKNLVNADFLGAMKPGAVFVNVGRGPLVDEDALLVALDAGTPEHAILDVFVTEPLDPESRFWAHERVAMTSHAAAIGDGRVPRGDTLFLENLKNFLAGAPLEAEVSREEVLASTSAREA